MALLATLTACSYPKAPYDPPLPTLATRDTGAPAAYVMLVGDSLSIKFYKNPELNEDVMVRSDGMISLQLVGDVPALILIAIVLAVLMGRQGVTAAAR